MTPSVASTSCHRARVDLADGDVHARGAQLQPQGVQEPAQAVLGGDVDRQAARRQRGQDRRRRDDHPARGAQVGQSQADRVHRHAQEDRQRGVGVLLGDRPERPVRRRSGDEDEDVDAAEALASRRQRSGQFRTVGEVRDVEGRLG